MPGTLTKNLPVGLLSQVSTSPFATTSQVLSFITWVGLPSANILGLGLKAQTSLIFGSNLGSLKTCTASAPPKEIPVNTTFLSRTSSRSRVLSVYSLAFPYCLSALWNGFKLVSNQSFAKSLSCEPANAITTTGFCSIVIGYK
ncbi:hypothetical protein D3C72_1559710 [compost metagenome]